MSIDTETDMLAARLYGPKDLRVDRIPLPGAPGQGQALLRVTVTTICGSDLHSYEDARIGDTGVVSPLVLGHEFAGVIEKAGPDALDGNGCPLREGQRVAVDPATPCLRCEFCEKGHPNLCRRLHFCGLYPDDGSLREYMLVPAHSCFPVPDELNDIEAALLEPLGIAIHAVDLARFRVEESVAILGAGPIGLMILQLARLSGAHPVIVSDRFEWRLEMARRYGADICIDASREDTTELIQEATDGRGVDVALEAAWGGETVAEAAEAACLGGRVVLVGIPGGDRLTMKASTARRKGLTIKMSRRMKHTYPRAISLAAQRKIDLMGMLTHRFPLSRAPEAFALNSGYRDRVVKVAVES